MKKQRHVFLETDGEQKLTAALSNDNRHWEEDCHMCLHILEYDKWQESGFTIVLRRSV